MNKLYRLMILAVLIPPFLFTCDNQGLKQVAFKQFGVFPALEPGDQIGPMTLTTGIKDAAPIWAFCLPTVESVHLITVECRDLSFATLAIGHTFGIMDLVPDGSDWSELTWKLSLDEHPIHLSAFDTYSIVHPDLALSPAPQREVFRSVKVWDIVLQNPTPGAHILHGQVQAGGETYEWYVKFTVTTDDH